MEPSEYGHEQKFHTVQSSSNGARFVLPLPVALLRELIRPWSREVSWGSSEKLLLVTSDNRTQLASLEFLQKVKGF